MWARERKKAKDVNGAMTIWLHQSTSIRQYTIRTETKSEESERKKERERMKEWTTHTRIPCVRQKKRDKYLHAEVYNSILKL